MQLLERCYGSIIERLQVLSLSLSLSLSLALSLRLLQLYHRAASGVRPQSTTCFDIQTVMFKCLVELLTGALFLPTAAGLCQSYLSRTIVAWADVLRERARSSTTQISACLSIQGSANERGRAAHSWVNNLPLSHQLQRLLRSTMATLTCVYVRVCMLVCTCVLVVIGCGGTQEEHGSTDKEVFERRAQMAEMRKVCLGCVGACVEVCVCGACFRLNVHVSACLSVRVCLLSPPCLPPYLPPQLPRSLAGDRRSQ